MIELSKDDSCIENDFSIVQQYSTSCVSHEHNSEMTPNVTNLDSLVDFELVGNDTLGAPHLHEHNVCPVFEDNLPIACDLGYNEFISAETSLVLSSTLIIAPVPRFRYSNYPLKFYTLIPDTLSPSFDDPSLNQKLTKISRDDIKDFDLVPSSFILDITQYSNHLDHQFDTNKSAAHYTHPMIILLHLIS